ncbi:hypothetical protein ACIREE_23755 [Streptomyces sp. NPDC102467]|uniref:hypothetical protein n=1 Tax=Streptomyces sp. NPDC102467 TaxID=3366179 RepID=UPI0037FF7178
MSYPRPPGVPGGSNPDPSQYQGQQPNAYQQGQQPNASQYQDQQPNPYQQGQQPNPSQYQGQQPNPYQQGQQPNASQYQDQQPNPYYSQGQQPGAYQQGQQPSSYGQVAPPPPQFPSQYPPGYGAQAPVPPAAPRRGGGGALRVTFGVLGVLLLIGGGALAFHAYGNSRQTIANTAYGTVLWRDEKADAFFPDTIGGRARYDGPLTDPKHAEWRRLGISQDTACASGLTGKTRATAKTLGCEAVLRATYVDPTGNQLATVAVAVMPAGGGDAETSAKMKLGRFFEERDGKEGAVNVLPVKGTLAAKMANGARAAAQLKPVGGDSMPYLVGVTLVSADGTWAGNLPGSWGENDLDGRTDRTSWQGDADDLVDTFRAQLEDLQMGGVKQ